MSTIFDIRKLRLPQLSRAAVIIGSLVVAVGLVAAVVGWQLYEKLTNNTVVAYFPAANALYAGDKVVRSWASASVRSTRSNPPATR